MTGIKELFEENTEILCFNPGDSQDLVSKIEWCFFNRKEISKIGKLMQKKYRDNFSQELITASFLRILLAQTQQCSVYR